MAKLYKLTILSVNKTFKTTNKKDIMRMCKLTSADIKNIIKYKNHKDYFIERTTTEEESLKEYYESLKNKPKEIRVREKMPLCGEHGMYWVYTKKV